MGNTYTLAPWQSVVTITPKEMATLTRVPMVITGAQTLTWRLFNEAFWSESTFPVDHPICQCGLCPFKNANLEHKFFGCIVVLRFWTEVAHMLNLSVHFQPKFDIFFMRSLKREPPVV
ncbi:hypothetical protein DSO57_1031494 [Entomophthora muscae]|uniref:Uncharacterized protein n=1 Tax=Entomophthora muscae TaxID=34485 RepID=A0ACC2SQ40_9FUNG|nr:hypothetical protein DSO57_1031494 [Entomophthora muscae]